jgi:hypothetical protein
MNYIIRHSRNGTFVELPDLDVPAERHDSPCLPHNLTTSINRLVSIANIIPPKYRTQYLQALKQRVEEELMNESQPRSYHGITAIPLSPPGSPRSH